MPFGPTHTFLRGIAKKAGEAFFCDVTVLHPENVPEEGPIIAACSHANTAVDPLILSCWFPHGRKLHYWAKVELFKNPLFSRILLDAGNLPVDRKAASKDGLYSSTFDVLKLGECVAVFPEGTSVHHPEILPLKDGSSFTALEYAKNVRSGEALTLSSGTRLAKPAKDVLICVGGITYTNKVKFRSAAIIEWAPPINVSELTEEYDKDPKAAAKKLTARMDKALRSVTVNASNWEAVTCAQMARELLWPEDLKIPRDQFRRISQHLVDLFQQDPLPDDLAHLKSLLLRYSQTLEKLGFTNLALGPRSLPSSMDPNDTVALPDRLSSLFSLFLDTCSSLIRLPFFFLPLILHLPVYLASQASFFVFDAYEPESFAQNKIVFGLLVALLLYPAVFITIWLFLLFTPVGALCAFGLVWLLMLYHGALIDTNYHKAKRLIGTWKVLVGIWFPQSHGEEGAVLKLLKLRAETAGALHRTLHARPELLDYLAKAGARMPSKRYKEA